MDNTETHLEALGYMKELYGQGLSYHDISTAVKDRFGVTYSDDNIR